MINSKSLGAASLALFMLAACGSLGDILGTGSPTSSGTTTNELRGTVDSVDTSSQSVVLTNVSGLTNNLSSGSNGQSVRVYYDNQTAVSYQGQSYRPADLERGDQVTVRVDQSNNRLMASSMEVTYNARGTSSGTYPSGSTYPSDSQTSTVRGTVRYVDTSRRTIEIEAPSWIAGFNRGTNSGNTVIVSYNTNATVDVQGQRQPVTGLERGDLVEIQVQNLGGSNYVAQNIYLIRDVNAR